MNLNTFRPENETEDLLLCITINCETPKDLTHTRSQETLEFKPTQSKQTLSFTLSFILGLESNWMLGLTSLEVFKLFLDMSLIGCLD